MSYIQHNSPFAKRSKPHEGGMSASERKAYKDKNGDCPNDIARRNWKC